MKKFKWIIWIVIIAAAGTGVWFWKFRKAEQTVVLTTEFPQRGTIATTVTATGTIQPVDTVAVGTRVSGTVSNVLVDFNESVKKGQLIAEIDKSLLEAELKQIKANLAQAKSNAVYQQSNFERQSKLYNVGAISKADYETALYQYNTANDNVNGVTAQLQSAESNLSYANIYSPITGTVLNRNVSVGQTVAASFSTPTLFVIARDLTKMQVQAAVDEADIGNVKKGQRVSFTVDAFPDDTFDGTVKEVRLRPSVSANVVTYVTIIDAPNEDLKLKPGMTASIVIYTREVKDALLISAKALNFKPDSAMLKDYRIERPHPPRGNGGPSTATGAEAPAGENQPGPPPDSAMANGSGTRAFVWIKKDSTLIGRPIETGMNDNTQVQVLRGLTTEDEIVTAAQQVQQVKTSSSSESGRSPFLPTPPGRSNRKSQSQRAGGPPPQ